MQYIQGEKNVVADALSRLQMETESKNEDSPMTLKPMDEEECKIQMIDQNPAQLLNKMEIMESPKFPNKARQELFYQYQIANTIENEEVEENPVNLSHIKEKQDQAPSLKRLVKDNKHYHTKIFHGAGIDYEMICHKDKTVIPQSLKSIIMELYHNTLMHPGRERTCKTISQHFYWKGMKNDVE